MMSYLWCVCVCVFVCVRVCVVCSFANMFVCLDSCMFVCVYVGVDVWIKQFCYMSTAYCNCSKNPMMLCYNGRILGHDHFLTCQIEYSSRKYYFMTLCLHVRLFALLICVRGNVESKVVKAEI